MAAFHPAGLDQRMLERIRRLEILAGSVIGVAFSGGNDSLALALVLARSVSATGIKPVLMHIDHQLRPESGDDLQQCVRLAGKIGLPILTGTLEPGIADRSGGRGIEQQARQERYALLETLCHEAGATLLATAHHQNDQAESVLMHLFRGSGLAGVAGMRERGPLPLDVDPVSTRLELEIWRPFLQESRATLEEYVAASGLDPVIDASNADVAFRRNAVRHEILPVIDRHFPQAAESISRFAGLVLADFDYMEAAAASARESMQAADGSLIIAELIGSPSPIASRVIRDWLGDAGIEEPTAERVRAVVRFARSGSDESHIEAGSGRWVVRNGDYLLAGLPEALIDRLVDESGFLFIDDAMEIVDGPGASDVHVIRSTKWTISIWEAASTAGSIQGDARSVFVHLPIEYALSDIEARATRPGDRMVTTKTPLRELLRAAGVHPLARRHVVCLAVGDDVVALPGYSRGIEGFPDRGPVGTRTVQISWQTKERRG